MPKTPSYLIVKFYDNDFGRPVQDALKRLWLYVHENNAHLLKEGETVAALIRYMHKVKMLVPAIQRLVDCEDLAGDVEYLTRELNHHHGRWGWPSQDQELKAGLRSITGDYLAIDVVFKMTDQEQKRWQNGEWAYLDLETGKAETF